MTNRRVCKASSRGVEEAGSDFFYHVIDGLQGYARKGEVHGAVFVIAVAGHEGGCRLGEAIAENCAGSANPESDGPAKRPSSAASLIPKSARSSR